MTIDSANSPTRLITGEELLRMGDIGPCELVRGRIVPMSPTGPRHGVCQAEIAYVIQRFLEENDLGVVMTGEVGVFTEWGPDTVRGADVAFMTHERFPTADEEGFLQRPPELVVEVLSKSNRPREISTKVREYLNVGVQLVWIADPKTHTIVAHRAGHDPRTYTTGDHLDGGHVLPGFSVPVSKLFR